MTRIVIEPLFEARCNCLYDSNNISTENLERLAKQLRLLGIPFVTNSIISSVERVGNWVGGQVSVFPEKVIFSMNRLNAKFQQDEADMVVPTDIISDARIGKMLIVAKTVDCEFMGANLRFRCNGKNNERLLDAIKSVAKLL